MRDAARPAADVVPQCRAHVRTLAAPSHSGIRLRHLVWLSIERGLSAARAGRCRSRIERPK